MRDAAENSEELLSGGNTTVVVRVGETVRRPVGAWTPAVHALLWHLESIGFQGAPRVLGIDDDDREVLRFVPGEVGTLSSDQPLPSWFRTSEACWTVGRWILQFQQAQTDFAPDPRHVWRRAPGSVLRPGEVVVHHDVSPYNTVRRDDGRIVVLDWDFARPGSPLEDLAWAAWRWAPLMAGEAWHAEYGVDGGSESQLRQQENLVALLEGYELPPRLRPALREEIHAQMTSHADDLEDMARTDPTFADLIDRDYARAARRDAEWWVSTGHALLGKY